MYVYLRICLYTHEFVLNYNFFYIINYSQVKYTINIVMQLCHLLI